MGLGAGIKKIFKFIVAGVMTLVFFAGLLVLLTGTGTIKNNSGTDSNTLIFVGAIVMIFGAIFGVIPFLSKIRWIIKFAFSLLGIAVFAYGICGCLNCYVGSITLEWANMAGWVSIVLIIIGTLFGVLPFFKCWGKFFDDDKKKSKSE